MSHHFLHSLGVANYTIPNSVTIATNNTIASTTVVSSLQLRLHAMGDAYTPRARDDDEVSLISMCELAPSPIDEDEYDHAASDDDPLVSKTVLPPLLQQSKSSALHHHSPHAGGLALWRNPPPPPTAAQD